MSRLFRKPISRPGKSLPGAIAGTRMADIPRKITDDPYGAWALIRRLVAEQATAYWRRYLLAFALMAVSAPTTGGAAYMLGEDINQADIDKSIESIALFSGV